MVAGLLVSHPIGILPKTGTGLGLLGIGGCSGKSGVVNNAAGANDADFVIIGSGHNSLSYAMMLGKAGYKVLILKGADQIGGAAKTGEVTLPGFRHDLYSTNIGLFMGGATFRTFKDSLFQHGFKPVVSRQPMASVFPDGTGLGVYTDINKTYESFKRVSPPDAEAWGELLAYFKKTAPLFMSLLQVPMPSFTALPKLYEIYSKLGTKGAYQLIQLLLRSPRQYCQYWFEHPKVQALIMPWAMHLDFGPDVSGGAAFPFLEPPRKCL